MTENPICGNSRAIAVLRLLAGGFLLLAVLTACNGNPRAQPAPTDIPQTSTGSAAQSTSPSPSVLSASVATHTKAAEATHNPSQSSTAKPDGAVPSRPAATVEETHKAAAEGFPVPPDRDYYRLATELIPGASAVDPVVRHNAPTLEVGHRETFNLVDLESKELYESEFELRLVTPHAYWFLEDGVNASQEDIEKSASEFEDHIYPKVTGVFGQEWTPGVDGDPHLYIINANLRGVGGYYSAADEYPREIRPVSNEIEAIYANVRYLPIGSDVFSLVLAHELQHAVHWNHDLSEETWVSEGLSELAISIAGYPANSVLEFRRAGPTSLTIWPANDVGGAENYGAASLFMQYLTEHYGGRDNLRPLLGQAEDGIQGINAFLEAEDHEVRFNAVFRDWVVANLLDEDTGRFGYSEMTLRFPVYRNMKVGGELQSTIPQYSNEYVRLEQPPTTVRLSFEGEETVPLLPEDTGDGCWWSNNGDVIDSTLTTGLDLRRVDSASLNYHVWFSIEEDWDYAYLEVSVDGGQSWTILETPLTSSEDPLNVSFGPGYTGGSEGWQKESVSLDRWAGQEIMVRFQYITDAAINDHGLCLQNIHVDSEDEATNLASDWTPTGFVWTNNRVRQGFMVQVVYEGDDGSANRVFQVELDDGNHGEIILEPDPDAKRIVAIIQPLAPSTRMPASYAMRLEVAE